MKRLNWLILAAVVFITAMPLWLVPKPVAEPAGLFSGADDKGQQVISEIAPDYTPWFAPLMAPASGEIASLLFALQAAIGAGVIGYWLGASVTRDKLRREAGHKAADRERHVD